MIAILLADHAYLSALLLDIHKELARIVIPVTMTSTLRV